MILSMFIFYLCLKQQDKHCIRHYDCDYDCDYDKKIRYKYRPLYFTPSSPAPDFAQCPPNPSELLFLVVTKTFLLARYLRGEETIYISKPFFRGSVNKFGATKLHPSRALLAKRAIHPRNYQLEEWYSAVSQ